MNKKTKEAGIGGKNISPEALEKRKEINKKILKLFILPIVIIFGFIGVFFATNNNMSEINSSEHVSTQEVKHLVQAFCYALQASLVCENLNMRLDTEGKIENQVGGKFRGQNTQYNDECLTGLNSAEGKGLCKKAWEKYGCSGTDIPRLIQENPFKIRDGVFCTY